LKIESSSDCPTDYIPYADCAVFRRRY